MIKKSKSTAVKICPNCKTPGLHRSPAGWMGTEIYRCDECDYSGAFYLEIDPLENGGKMADLDLLREDFPEEIEPETEINVEEIIQESNEIIEKAKKGEND